MFGVFVLAPINYLRADVEVMLWLSIALWAFARAEKTGVQRWHLAIGFAVGFSLDGHPNAYRLAITFAVVYMVDYAIELVNRRRFSFPLRLVYLLIGIRGGVGVYVALYAILAPDTFLRRVGAAELTFNPAWLLDGWAVQFASALQNGALLIGAAVVGGVVSLRHHQAVDRLLLLILFVSTGVLATTYGYYRDYYFIRHAACLALVGCRRLQLIGKLSDR